MLELPEELVYEIMQQLPQSDLGKLNRVSRDLHRIGSEDGLWRKKGFLKRTFESEGAGASMVPPPRLCHTTVVFNNHLHVFGGHNTEDGSQRFSEVKSDFFTYDLTKNTWEKRSVLNMQSKTEHTAVVSQENLYLFGGYSGHQFSNSMYVLNLAKEPLQCSLVKSSGDVPTGRSAHIGAVYDKRFYIFGGWDGLNQNNDFYVFNFDTTSWSRICSANPLPNPRCSHTVSVSHTRKAMYIFGGYGGKARSYLNDLWSFSFDTQTWTQLSCKGDVPSPRSRMRMVEWDDKLYVFGGWDKNVHFNDLFEYDIETATWTKLDIGDDESLKIGQHTMSVNDNLMYVFGGFSQKVKKSTNDLYIYRLGKPNLKRKFDDYEISSAPSTRNHDDFKLSKWECSNDMEIDA